MNGIKYRRLRDRGFTFALAHIKSESVSDHLNPTAKMMLPAGAVMMPMWVIDAPSSMVVLCILGSEPDPESTPVSISRDSFLSLTKAP
jgi:hypothetical protein